MLKNLITFTISLLAISAVELLFFPSRMLAVVGVTLNTQMDFLLRVSGAGVVALIPGLWAARTSITSPVARAVLMGAASYLFISSIVDFFAYLQSIVNGAAIPSWGACDSAQRPRFAESLVKWSRRMADRLSLIFGLSRRLVQCGCGYRCSSIIQHPIDNEPPK